MTTVNRLDLVISILFALVGAYVLVGSMELKAMPGMAVGPGLFPAVTGAGMLFFGLVMLAQTWMGRGTDASEELAVEEPIDDDGGPITLIDRLYNPLLLLAILALIIFMPILGFLVTAMIFTVAMVLLGGGRWLPAIVFGAVMTGLTYALFVYGLRVPVPVAMWG